MAPSHPKGSGAFEEEINTGAADSEATYSFVLPRFQIISCSRIIPRYNLNFIMTKVRRQIPFREVLI